MSIRKTTTFRSHLLGNVEDFVVATGLQPLVTATTITNLVVALAHYTEEGKSLRPAIFLTSSIEKLLKFLPGSSSIKIGSCPAGEDATTRALKHCAPVAVGGWCIYVSQADSEIHYGVFRDVLSPLAIPIDEAVLGTGNDNVKIVRIHQSAPSCVDLENHGGDKQTIYLSQRLDTDPSPRHFIDDLAKSICIEVNQSLRDTTEMVVRKFLTVGLDESHGALIAVTRMSTTPAFLKDGLKLAHPIKFADLVRAAREGGEEDRFRLLSHMGIIQGMLSCDGIILFNSKACLLGYNCFVSSKNLKITEGGARKRAYQALQEKLGRGLSAVFIRSQDGWSEFKKSNSNE